MEPRWAFFSKSLAYGTEIFRFEVEEIEERSEKDTVPVIYENIKDQRKTPATRAFCNTKVKNNSSEWSHLKIEYV